MKKDKTDDSNADYREQMTDDRTSDNREQMTDDSKVNESKKSTDQSPPSNDRSSSTNHQPQTTIHRTQSIDCYDDEIDLVELFTNIYKNKKIIIKVTAFFFFLGLLYSSLLVPNYKATFFAKNGIKDFDGYTPVSSLNISELSDWIESELYFSESKDKNFVFEVEKKKNSNLLRFITYANDTKEVSKYSQYFFKQIKENDFFKEPIKDSIIKFGNLIEEKNNKIKLTNIELENISNRIKEIEFKIEKNLDEINITKDKIAERERTLEEYRKLYSLNIKKNDEFQKKIENSAVDSDSTTYLLYSNLLQYNLNQNTELIKTINNYETSIKDMNIRINTLINQNKDLEIKKEELISKNKKSYEIDIQTLNLDKKLLNEKLNRLNVIEPLNDFKIEFNIIKKLQYIILSFILGLFLGLFLIFVLNFKKEINNKMTEDGSMEGGNA